MKEKWPGDKKRGSRREGERMKKRWGVGEEKDKEEEEP